MDMLQLQSYAGGVPALPPGKQQVWNLIGQGKMVMDHKIQNHALKIQQITAGFETMDAAALAVAMKQYRETYLSLVDDRKGFTLYLDVAKDKCMSKETELRPDTNPIYQAMKKREIDLREAATKVANDAKAKVDEITAYRAHMITQLQEKAMSYRDVLAKLVHDYYIDALQHKVTDPAILEGYKNKIVSLMVAAKPAPGVPFQRRLIPDAEAEQIYKSLTQPDYQRIFNDNVTVLNDKFALYANDLANVEQSVANQQQTFATQQAEQSQNDEAEKAAATLYVQATAPVLTMPTGLKPLTETSKIKVMGESKEWVVKIMSAFLAHFQVCIEKVRTKKENPDYSTLSIERMAAALDAAGVKIEGIEYETIKK